VLVPKDRLQKGRTLTSFAKFAERNSGKMTVGKGRIVRVLRNELPVARAIKMPYVTRAQREKLKWYDLGFAIERIRAFDNCDESAAVAQLRLAVADESVRLSWGDQPRRYVELPIFDSEIPPTGPLRSRTRDSESRPCGFHPSREK
jgi:hypothetical protein